MSFEPEKEKPEQAEEIETDETAVTEIRIAPDGRMRIFGLSRELLALLCETGLADESLRQRLAIETKGVEDGCQGIAPDIRVGQ